ASHELPRLRKGMEAQLSNAAGESVSGKIRQIAPTVDARTREAIVYVDLPADAGVRAGEFVEGELVTATEPVLTVAQEALIVRDGFSWVFTLESDLRVRQRKVQTGQMRGNEVEILSGLNEKQRVVTTGVGFLHDGDAVRIAPPVGPLKKAAPANGERQPAKDTAAANGKGKARP
ncbi:MAG: HlyD family efflux transporter periplasmic adaptor subunit, partial [Rhodocyclaceae bacterium]|nr:HlyD family efflux transporter periplasmic adaptor subunit [Rhodocyclaceae bacterium]